MKSKPSPLTSKLQTYLIAATLFVGQIGLFAAPAAIAYLILPEQGQCYVTADKDVVGDCY